MQQTETALLVKNLYHEGNRWIQGKTTFQMGGFPTYSQALEQIKAKFSGWKLLQMKIEIEDSMSSRLIYTKSNGNNESRMLVKVFSQPKVN